MADALNTDVKNGLCNKEDICQRKMKMVFQSQLPEVSFIRFLIDACNNCTMRLLLLAAALALGFGLKEEGRQNGWIDGAIIFGTIIVLVLCTSLRRYFHEKKSLKKSRKQDSPNEMEMEVRVTRGEPDQRINICDLVYGDIVSLDRGDQVPGDGLFIDGKSLEVDSVLRSTIDDQNPFLFYGSRIINGSGRMLVTSVSTNTVWSEMMSKANSADKNSKLEPQFDKLTNLVNIIGLVITILIFIVLFLRFVVWKQEDGNGYRSEFNGEPTALRMIINTIEKIVTGPKGMARALTTLLSVSLVGLMERIPLVVSIAVTLWNDNTLADKATYRDSLDCVKLAPVTCICTDKIGGLTEHLMEVDTFSIGYEVITESSMISPKVLEVLCEGIGTSVLIPQDACSSMEASLCSWAKDVVGFRSNIFEQTCKILQRTKPGRDPSENSCGVLMERIGDGGKEMCLHWKGPVEQILDMCSHYYDRKGKLQDMDSQKRLDFKHANTDMMNKQLKAIAFACRPTVACELEKKDLILIGLLGLRDSSKENTKEAIARAFKGGVKTIIVSADDVSVLEPIAVEYGVHNLDSDDLVLKGEDFQNFTETERMEKVDRICVMGNCLPSDKQVLVKYLRERGKVVAMVGWQTNDAPALKKSDIGVAMGTWNSGKARESADIIIWDGSLSFLVNMIECGRCAYGKLQKFIQVQLIMTISGSLITFIGIIFMGDAPMTPIQLFGLNLAMTFIHGMALLSGPLSGKQVSELTVSPTEPLIMKAMTRNIVLQTSYQIIILTTLQQKGHLIIGITQKSIRYMIFNSFILCLVFNLFHSRELDKKNFFGGIHHDHLIWVALAVYSLFHLVFILVEQRLDRSTSLNCKKWAGCFLIGIVSWLVDFVGKVTLQANRIDCFTGWIIVWAGKCKSVFIEKDWFTRRSCSYPVSSPPELISNLHYPLITSSESSTIPVQNHSLQ